MAKNNNRLAVDDGHHAWRVLVREDGHNGSTEGTGLLMRNNVVAGTIPGIRQYHLGAAQCADDRKSCRIG